LSIVATTVIAVYAGARQVSAKAVLWKIVSFPPFISMLFALCIPSTQALGIFLPLVNALAATILPLAMLMIGLQLQLKIDPAHRAPMLVVTVGQLILWPVVVALLGAVLAVRDEVVQPSVMQAAMPPMVTPAILLIAAGLAPRFVASTLGVATLLSCITIPLWARWLLGA
ncbi:MAG: hypothetical protein HKO71_07930, partial [Pseudomonadales bacterium]|nr:AEC family transporter [Gammaproteobacteria bacterium]NNL57667.1 hypothetical protein [Pseudomonadales bacterium]